jgi:hypothetical protein
MHPRLLPHFAAWCFPDRDITHLSTFTDLVSGKEGALAAAADLVSAARPDVTTSFTATSTPKDVPLSVHRAAHAQHAAHTAPNTKSAAQVSSDGKGKPVFVERKEQDLETGEVRTTKANLHAAADRWIDVINREGLEETTKFTDKLVTLEKAKSKTASEETEKAAEETKKAAEEAKKAEAELKKAQCEASPAAKAVAEANTKTAVEETSKARLEKQAAEANAKTAVEETAKAKLETEALQIKLAMIHAQNKLEESQDSRRRKRDKDAKKSKKRKRRRRKRCTLSKASAKVRSSGINVTVVSGGRIPSRHVVGGTTYVNAAEALHDDAVDISCVHFVHKISLTQLEKFRLKTITWIR